MRRIADCAHRLCDRFVVARHPNSAHSTARCWFLGLTIPAQLPVYSQHHLYSRLVPNPHLQFSVSYTYPASLLYRPASGILGDLPAVGSCPFALHDQAERETSRLPLPPQICSRPPPLPQHTMETRPHIFRCLNAHVNLLGILSHSLTSS